MCLRVFCLVLLMANAGCSLMYRTELRQGTVVSDEALANLRLGLTKRQVRLVLGTPAISDPFHPDRWDYVYSVGKAGDPMPVPPRLTLYFSNDLLVSAEGELAPAGLRTMREAPAAGTLPGDKPNTPDSTPAK